MALVLLVFLLLCFKQLVEAQMVLHMFVQLPALYAVGWMVSNRSPPKWVTSMNSQGMLGLVVILAVSAVWMIPTALDMALTSTSVSTIKVFSWVVAGSLARYSWKAMAVELKCFLLGNLAWMFLSVGMLYQSTERRLCVNYLVDDQLQSGRLLVALGFVLGARATWLVFQVTQPSAVGDVNRRTNRMEV